MTRLPVPSIDLTTPGPWVLDEQQAHYLTRVRRLNVGDSVEVFDGRGQEMTCRLIEEGHRWMLESCGSIRMGRTGADVTVCYGLPKGDKLDRVVRQLTELGIGRMIPLLTANSIVRLKGERAEKKRQRLQRITDEAARQCGRSDTMEISAAMTLTTYLANSHSDTQRLVFDPTGKQGLKLFPIETPVSIFIGPESGFSPEELNELSTSGAQIVSIGQLILRTETAAPVCAALVLHRLGLL